MIRRPTGLRQYYAVIKHLVRPRTDIKKVAWASTALAVTIGGGAAILISNEPPSTQTKPQTVMPSSNNPSIHPLLGIDQTSNSLPSLPELSDHRLQSNSTTSDSPTNEAMHQTTITINGESIEIPPSGSSSQTIKNQDGSHTEVDIQHEQTQVNGTPRSNIIIDSKSKSSSASSSLNSRITITH